MSNKVRKDKNATADGYAYLTKRLLVSKAKRAIESASKEAMEIMGYVVVAEDGWIVKKYADGSVEQMEQLPSASSYGELALD